MDLIKNILEAPGLLKEIYGDLAKPGVQQVGKALSTVIGLGNTILWPIALMNERARLTLESNLEKYRARMENVESEEIVEVPPEIGVPIAEKLSYVKNEYLSQLYVELLAKASIHHYSKFAHPSFVNVLDNLSPDEAHLVKRLKNQITVPFVEVRLKKIGKNEWNVLKPILSELDHADGLLYPSNIAAYLSNFEGLGLLTVRTDIIMAGAGVYEPLEEIANKMLVVEGSEKPKVKIECKRGKIDLTPFGMMFVKACNEVV